MKSIKLVFAFALAAAMVACNRPAGELVGVTNSTQFKEANPFGMIFIRKGSFMMGANTQSAVFEQQDNIYMATVEDFWMDETEITNNEYKQFVHYVRDSIALRLLVEAGLTDYAVQSKNEEFDEENYRLNWNKKIPWDSKNEDEQEAAEALIPMYYPGTKELNVHKLTYSYSWINYDQAVLNRNKFDATTGSFPDGAEARVDTAWVDETGRIHEQTIVRPVRAPRDFMTNKIISIYPDTLTWIRDFQYAYNDPMTRQYFSHQGYLEYPVVGVSWEQAHAFCHWRTAYLMEHSKVGIECYRLPTEAEWEYAARGGRKMAMYPWGGNYARDAKGCFFANFKPYRGSYGDDTGNTTCRVGQFRPNDFGLFDMAGNVAEWTYSAFQPVANTNVHDMNPSFSYMARIDDPDILKKKVVKGGSWKDISYFLQCGVRTYEYQYQSRPYIGFRCVRSYIGD